MEHCGRRGEAKHAGEIVRRPEPAVDVRAPEKWDYESAVAVLPGSNDQTARAAAAKAMRQFANEDGAWCALLRPCSTRMTGCRWRRRAL
jgi:hypothetical protein